MAIQGVSVSEAMADIPAIVDSGRGRPRRRRSLRNALLLMLFAPVAPLLIVCGAALWYQWETHTAQTFQSLIDTASALSVAVEREINRTQATLEALAASELIDAKDWRAFHRHASEAIKSEPNSFIALAEPSGTQPVRTMLPYGAPTVNPSLFAQSHTETEWKGRRLPLSTQGLAKRVFETGRMSNTGLYFGVSIQQPAVAIAIPVVRNGRVAYVLIKGFAVEALVKLLQDANRPDARITLIDGSGKIIARNQRPLDGIGMEVSDTLRAAIKVKQHGTREGANLDGIPTISAYRSMEAVDWAVNVSMPKSAALALAKRHLVIWSVLGVALVTLGLYGARRFWLRVAPPIALLGQAAPAIQRGEPVDLPHSEISEIDDLTAVLRNAAAAEMRERAERERSTLAITRSEARFRTLFEHAGTGIALIESATGRFVLVNRCLAEITGYSDQELLQRGFAGISHPDDATHGMTLLNQLSLGMRDGCDEEMRYMRKDGSLGWVEMHLRPFPKDGDGTPVILASLSDITERKQAELALKEADQRKDEFLATLAHELRNPLAPLRTGMEILRLERDDPGVTARVRPIMERQVTHMVRLMDDLLDVSRIRTGRLQLHVAEVSVAEVVREAVETYQSVFDAAGHRLSVVVADVPLVVKGDRTRLIQVVGNLLTNAAKYTGAPGDIRVKVFRRDDKAIISVADTGIGIPADKLEVVFNMFTQVRGAEAGPNDRGLGIGLHIVKSVVELHGGTVVARSAGEGAGSEFIVELPLLREQFDAAQKEPPEAGCSTNPPLSILVVDDSHDAAESLATLLTIFGHNVQTAHSGAQALEMMTAARPQLVLLDVGMPGLDGYEVARRIRAASPPVRPVIAAVSGWGQAEDKIKTAAAGFDLHLVKPVDLADLQAAIAAVMRSAGRAPSA